jgi:hypothetical protein
MRVIAAALALVLSFGAAQDPPVRHEAPEVDRGTIAVLRRDGLMLPFAAFRGTRWQMPWPQGVRALELPINVASIPERWWGGWTPEGWQAWLLDGTTRELALVAPQMFQVHCAPRVGVRTDHMPREPLPFFRVEPFPKDGLAVTAGLRVEPVATVGPAEGDWSQLAVSLLEDFDRVETAEISMLSSVWKHPVGRDRRSQVPVQIESWYRTALDDGSMVSYIEAARKYPPGPDDEECGLETLFSGWVTHEKGRERPRAELGARITYCDRVGATFMRPFGRIRVAERIYWIAQVAGPETEWYIVAQLAPGRLRYVAEYFAGGRSSCGPTPRGG